MKILLIGASGATGQLLLPKLLAAGHKVTALVRTPGSVTLNHPALTVVIGDARNAPSILHAVSGQDAVISAFGPRSLKADDLQEVMMKNLVAAMTATGVKRLVNLSAWGADPQQVTSLSQKIFSKLVIGRVLADKHRGEMLLAASAIDYVNVCPGRLLNTPAQGGMKASLTGVGIKPSLTREDLAQFMIEQLSSDTWLRKNVVVGY